MTDPEITQQIADLLIHYLHFLLIPTAVAGKDAAMKAMGERFVEAGWNKAAQIWTRFLPEVERKPEVAQALQEVAKTPDDPDARAVLSWQLKKVMVDMPQESIDEIRSIIAENVTDIRIATASNGSVAIGGNASGNIINIVGSYGHNSLGQQQQIEDTDFWIMQAIQDLGVSIPNVNTIIACVDLDPDELGARLGVMHSRGLIRVEKGTYAPELSLSNGIYAAGLTDLGRLALINRTKH